MRTIGESYVERQRCPVYAAMRVIEGRWKPMICRRLGERTHGFGELHRAMPGVTVKVLRQQLRQLEADGVVSRTVHEGSLLRVRYRLTPYGRTLGPVFDALWSWGTRHLARRPVIRVRHVRSPPMYDSKPEQHLGSGGAVGDRVR
jgi:DNA-binding HxlR family transcriptional regulator